MTINKAQGQTLRFVGLYLPEPVFAHGQAYVGASRSGNPSGLFIAMDEIEDQQGDLFGDGKHYTKNVVYKEVL